jgi:anti-sigma B factor antagonist
LTAPSGKQIDEPAKAARMSVETAYCDVTRALVRVSGDLDISTAAPLRAVLDGHLASGRRFLRLDLSQVTFLDAAALGGITRVHHNALAARGTLVITGARPPVARMLRVTGLDDVLFVGGARAEDDCPLPDPVTDPAADRSATVWAAQPVPSTPLAIARSTPTVSTDRPGGNRRNRD